MKILVTGANGFIGKNLVLRLREESGVEVLTYLRDEDDAALTGLLVQADAVVHLAGENRPLEESAFSDVNFGLTKRLCQHISALGKNTPVLFTSSVQADQDNPYGRSKIAAEQALEDLAEKHCNPVAIYRLPGVFGKWCKPNYNSVVATLCYNKARGLPTQVNDANARVRLVYIDDVVDALILQLDSSFRGLVRPTICPEYSITLGELSAQIDAFQNCRTTLVTEDVGTGFIRALYACYVSYLPTDKFAYDIPIHSDSRGMFVEMLKTLSAGQFSFFTAHPGITRGGHYHHSKTEKFLVIKGSARFGFRHMLTNEMLYIETHGDQPKIIETIPGWAHDITNIGTEEMVVMLWANEIFDRINPDTIVSKV